MKKILTILFLANFLLIGIANAQEEIPINETVSISTLENQEIQGQNNPEELQNQVNSLERRLKIQEDTFDNIGTLITFAGIIISIFALFLTIFGFCISWYIKNQANKGKKFLDDTKKIQKDVQELKQDTVKFVDKYGNSIIRKIEKKETGYILNRLIEVPEDISNVFSKLASRDIPNEKKYFDKLKEAYLNLKSILKGKDRFDKIIFMSMFFQHFAGFSLFDDDIKDDFEEEYKRTIDRLFVRDIKNAIKSIIEACIDNDINNQKEKLLKFFKSINDYGFKDNIEVYETIFKNLISKKNHFIIFDFIKDEEGLDVFKKEYSKILIDKYKADGNSGTQKSSLEKASEFINPS